MWIDISFSDACTEEDDDVGLDTDFLPGLICTNLYLSIIHAINLAIARLFAFLIRMTYAG